MKKYLVLLIIASLLLVGCGTKKSEKTTTKKEKDYIIVDVRTEDEYNESHVKGAINIPYDEIDEDTDLDKNKLIKVYCKSGVRSKKAYDTLKELGYDVEDLGAFDSINLEIE